jgi:hypothetical protein
LCSAGVTTGINWSYRVPSGALRGVSCSAFPRSTFCGLRFHVSRSCTSAFGRRVGGAGGNDKREQHLPRPCFHGREQLRWFRFHASTLSRFSTSTSPASTFPRFGAIQLRFRAFAPPRFQASAFPCFHVSAFPCIHALALPHLHASALPHLHPRFHASALPHFPASMLPRFHAESDFALLHFHVFTFRHFPAWDSWDSCVVPPLISKIYLI